MQNNQRFSIERKNTHDPKWACGLFAVFPVENVTQAPSPSSPFHSSMSLLLQFSHRLSCVVVVYLVLATIYGRLSYGVGGRFPMWEGRGVVPGSTGVLRVACPWVRCRAPPGWGRRHQPFSLCPVIPLAMATHDPSLPRRSTKTQIQMQDPIIVQLDPKWSVCPHNCGY